jgi:saccharopine dehydrogenase-like NADP-dependent oxidoreductase
MADILLVGAGRIGIYMAEKLRDAGLNIAIADIDPRKLEYFKDGFETRRGDILDKNDVRDMTRDVDWVLTALPGSIAYRGLVNILENGKNIIDISFYPEDMWRLGEIAEKHNVLYMPDAGVAPGLSNVIAAHLDRDLGGADKIEIYVGGISYKPDEFLGMALTWSPIDLLEEYIRPARIIIDGEVAEVDPLETTGMIHIPGVGEMEYFASDGLRSLLKTMSHVPNMKEFTLRYRGHVFLMRFLKWLGLLSYKDIRVGETVVKPIEVLAEILETSMENRFRDRVILYILGEKDDMKREYLLQQSFDEKRRFSGMSIVTGSTAVAMILLGYRGEIDSSGLYPPEYVGMDDRLYRMFMGYLEEMDVKVERIS